jgi:hypothetical protein
MLAGSTHEVAVFPRCAGQLSTEILVVAQRYRRSGAEWHRGCLISRHNMGAVAAGTTGETLRQKMGDRCESGGRSSFCTAGWVLRAGYGGLGTAGWVRRAGYGGLGAAGWVRRAGYGGLGAAGWVRRAGCGGLGAAGWVRRAGCGGLGAAGWVRRAGCGGLGAAGWVRRAGYGGLGERGRRGARAAGGTRLGICRFMAVGSWRPSRQQRSGSPQFVARFAPARGPAPNLQPVQEQQLVQS